MRHAACGPIKSPLNTPEAKPNGVKRCNFDATLVQHLLLAFHPSKNLTHCFYSNIYLARRLLLHF